MGSQDSIINLFWVADMLSYFNHISTQHYGLNSLIPCHKYIEQPFCRRSFFFRYRGFSSFIFGGGRGLSGNPIFIMTYWKMGVTFFLLNFMGDKLLLPTRGNSLSFGYLGVLSYCVSVS